MMFKNKAYFIHQLMFSQLNSTIPNLSLISAASATVCSCSVDKYNSLQSAIC